MSAKQPSVHDSDSVNRRESWRLHDHCSWLNSENYKNRYHWKHLFIWWVNQYADNHCVNSVWAYKRHSDIQELARHTCLEGVWKGECCEVPNLCDWCHQFWQQLSTRDNFNSFTAICRLHFHEKRLFKPSRRSCRPTSIYREACYRFHPDWGLYIFLDLHSEWRSNSPITEDGRDLWNRHFPAEELKLSRKAVWKRWRYEDNLGFQWLLLDEWLSALFFLLDKLQTCWRFRNCMDEPLGHPTE